MASPEQFSDHTMSFAAEPSVISSNPEYDAHIQAFRAANINEIERLDALKQAAIDNVGSRAIFHATQGLRTAMERSDAIERALIAFRPKK